MPRIHVHALPADPLHVDADIRRARTLPPAAFTDAAFLERELTQLFPRAWLALPDRTAAELRDDTRTLPDLVRRRGAHAPVTLLDRPLFLKRDWEGTLRAFPNVCTHAWHTLVQGPGRDRHLTCPQHGRKFDADGHCLTQPGFEDVPDFPSREDDLPELAVHEWGPLLFTSLGNAESAFEDRIAPVHASLGGLPLDGLERRPQAGEVREVAGNWKQHAWNYLDSLHIPYVHRQPGGLADAVDLKSYRTELHRDAVLQWAYAQDPEHGFDPALLPERFHDPDDRRVFALWWFVWPNLTLNLYPWGLSVNQYNPVPGRPDRTLFLWYHYSWDDAKYARREDAWMLQGVDDEDVEALGQVARGLRSGFATRGRFAPDHEKAPHWFHRRVADAVRPQ